jgi:hypothetical protein
MRCSEDREFELLSVVGRIASVLDSSGGYCAGTAHPWASSVFRAIDLSRSATDAPVQIALTEVFPERDVLAALLADRFVKAALAAAGQATPKSVAQLVEALKDSPVRAGDCEFTFDERALTGFAFHHRERERVAVRLSLPHRHEACRGMNTQLGLLLPVPEDLEGSLARADARTAGFLMKDQARVSRGLSTSLETSYGPASKVER